jgi:hypothetical protein
VFAEFTLNGGYVDKHPEAWPINERGEKEPADVFMAPARPIRLVPAEPNWRSPGRRETMVSDGLRPLARPV